MKYVMGIDPGKNGCFVILDEDGQEMDRQKMPVVGKSFDLKAIKQILLYYQLKHVVVEDVPIIFGIEKSSMCDIYKGVGILMGLLEGLNISYTMIPPKVWQAEMWVGIKKVMKNTARQKKDGGFVQKVETKATSFLAAQRLFPATNLSFPAPDKFYANNPENRKLNRVGQKMTKAPTLPHDGLIDALLMAEFCRRKFR